MTDTVMVRNPCPCHGDMKEGEWIAIDLDGTLAHWVSGHSVDGIGAPIEAMCEQVKHWVRVHHHDVRIFTARVAATGRPNQHGGVDDVVFAQKQRDLIEDWCLTHLSMVLPITAIKDFRMHVLYDDRAVRVLQNQGKIADGQTVPLTPSSADVAWIHVATALVHKLIGFGKMVITPDDYLASTKKDGEPAALVCRAEGRELHLQIIAQSEAEALAKLHNLPVRPVAKP
jgi:hypothetical protein